MAGEEDLHAKLWIVQEGILLDISELAEVLPTSRGCFVRCFLIPVLLCPTFFVKLLAQLGVVNHCDRRALLASVRSLVIIFAVVGILGRIKLLYVFVFLRLALNGTDEPYVKTPLSEGLVACSGQSKYA